MIEDDLNQLFQKVDKQIEDYDFKAVFQNGLNLEQLKSYKILIIRYCLLKKILDDKNVKNNKT